MVHSKLLKYQLCTTALPQSTTNLVHFLNGKVSLSDHHAVSVSACLPSIFQLLN